MKKLDLRKQFKELYTPPSKKVVDVDVPKFNFLMIDGVGNPNTSQEYQDALGALYNIAYTLKFGEITEAVQVLDSAGDTPLTADGMGIFVNAE